MKKFIFKILLFFVITGALDVFWGFACNYMNANSKGGGTKSRYYACMESNEDVIIFGSSRAKHHYVPYIFEDSLGLTCYNTGEDGNGIIFCYGMLKMITQRYSPKFIVYDVSKYDMFEDDNFKYVNYLKPFYNEPGIDSLFWSVYPKSRILMCSNFYRYNSNCISLAGNYFHPSYNYPNGYMPLYETMNYDAPLEPMKAGPIDSLKMNIFENFIELVQEKKIPMVCCVSPMYRDAGDTTYYSSIIRLCKKHNVPFVRCSDSYILSEKSMYKDRTHLNNDGASYYTNRVISFLKENSFVDH